MKAPASRLAGPPAWTSGTPDGHLLVRSSKKAAHSDVVYYAKWRDGSGGQVKRLLGPAWVEWLGGEWRKRRGVRPDG